MFTVCTIPKARGAAMAFCDEEGAGGLRTCCRSGGDFQLQSNELKIESTSIKIKKVNGVHGQNRICGK